MVVYRRAGGLASRAGRRAADRSARVVGVLIGLAVALAPAGDATADEFTDFGIDALHVVADGTGTYLVSVTVSISAGALPPTQDISLDVFENGVSLVASTGVQTLGVESQQCCADSSTCSPLDGRAVTCGGSCGAPPPSHVCIYHTATTFGGLGLTPGATVTATLDGGGLHTETEPGAETNNSAAAVVPDPIPTGGAFANLAITDLRPFPVSPGLYDVAADLAIAPEVVAPTASVEVRLLADGVQVASYDYDTSGAGAQLCCACVGGEGTCPDPDPGSVCCDEECTNPAMKETARCVCIFVVPVDFGHVAVSAGADLTAVVDPDGLHTQTIFGASGDDAFTVTLAASVPSQSGPGLVVLALLLLLTGGIAYGWQRREASTGGG